MTPRAIARGAGRAAVVLAVAFGIGLFGLQFGEIVMKNVALAHEIDASHARAGRLHDRIRRQRATIARLNAPGGAVPEIHDELQLVGPHEEIIYVRGATPATPEPDDAGP